MLIQEKEEQKRKEVAHEKWARLSPLLQEEIFTPLKEFLEGRLSDLQRTLECVSPDEETNTIRGRIAEVRTQLYIFSKASDQLRKLRRG